MFVVALLLQNMLCNGSSTSPTNTAMGADFPVISVIDNVLLQRRLLSERLKIDRLAMVYGFSMGAAQALHWVRSPPAWPPGVVEAPDTWVDGRQAGLRLFCMFTSSCRMCTCECTAAL